MTVSTEGGRIHPINHGDSGTGPSVSSLASTIVQISPAGGRGQTCKALFSAATDLWA